MWNVLAVTIWTATISAVMTLSWYENTHTALWRKALYSDLNIYMASFPVEENCEIARGLFRGQPGVIVDYWCEPESVVKRILAVR